MPTILFASSKRRAGKTTTATVFVSELARQGKQQNINVEVSLIDVDHNQHSAL